MYNDQAQIGYGFWQFKDLVLRANHTYQIVTQPTDSGLLKTEMFNLSKNIHSYELTLSRQYNQVVHEIVTNLENSFMKIDKLNYLSLILVEIETLQHTLKHSDNGSLVHVNYQFTNISEDPEHQKEKVGADHIQPYLMVLDKFLKKLLRYIDEVKNNIALIPQQDFPIPLDLMVKPFDSTIDQPENWFDYLITKNGLQVIKNDFIPKEDDQQYVDHISYDEVTETRLIAERDPETGEWNETYTKFFDVLQQILYKEFNKTKAYVDQKINTFPAREPVSFFLELMVTRLKYLFNVASSQDHTKKYTNIPGAIKALIRFIYEKYAPYCPPPDEVTTGILKESKIYTLKAPSLLSFPQSSNPGVFRWIKGNSDQLSLLLHGALNEIFIAKTELLDFDQIFKGGSLTKQIKIKWIDRPTNGGLINKVNLLYLFKKLDEAGLIDVNFESKDMFYKLEHIFTDAEGNRIEHLPQSKANVLKIRTLTNQQKKILEIVNLLSSKI